MINIDEKNLVLSNYNVKEIDNLPTDSEKIKYILNYLEDVNILLNKYHETIHSLLESNKTIFETLSSHQQHLGSHDQHLEAHGEHLGSHDQQLALK